MTPNYPFASDGRGGLLLVDEQQALAQKITYLLRTRKFTRVLNQDFGLPDYAFQASPTFPELEIAITQAIKEWFPEVEEIHVKTQSRDHDSGKFLVSLEVGTIAPFTIEI